MIKNKKNTSFFLKYSVFKILRIFVISIIFSNDKANGYISNTLINEEKGKASILIGKYNKINNFIMYSCNKCTRHVNSKMACDCRIQSFERNFNPETLLLQQDPADWKQMQCEYCVNTREQKAMRCLCKTDEKIAMGTEKAVAPTPMEKTKIKPKPISKPEQKPEPKPISKPEQKPEPKPATKAKQVTKGAKSPSKPKVIEKRKPTPTPQIRTTIKSVPKKTPPKPTPIKRPIQKIKTVEAKRPPVVVKKPTPEPKSAPEVKKENKHIYHRSKKIKEDLTIINNYYNKNSSGSKDKVIEDTEDDEERISKYNRKDSNFKG